MGATQTRPSSSAQKMSQGHRLYDHAALRQSKIEKLRLDNLRSSSPRLPGTGSACELSRTTVPSDWLVGGKNGGCFGNRSLTPRAMPWEKQPAIEDATAVRIQGEYREAEEAIRETGGTGSYTDMLASARSQVGKNRSRSATGVASHPACTVRDRKSFNRSGGSIGPGFGSPKSHSPRFKAPKQNGMDPKYLPGPAGSYNDGGKAAEDNDLRVNQENWRGHTTTSQRDATRSSPWSASKTAKMSALSHSSGYKDNCTVLLVSNYFDGTETSGNRIRELLRSSFEKFGRVRSVRLTKQYDSALVEYDLHDGAQTALKFLKDQNDQSMRPSWAMDIEVDYYKNF